MNNKLVIKNVVPYDIGLTLDCGQAFRWKLLSNGHFGGIAMGKYLEVEQSGNDIVFYNTTKNEYESLWKNYFDIERDYASIIRDAESDKTMQNIVKGCSGIRVLNQEPWETLCSFIISQNNNIPRIKGIIERLCENFGQKLENGYTFPSAKVLSTMTVEDLAPLRSGFRAKYIIDAAKKCADNSVDLESLKVIDINSAREVLMTIKGVGPKVADCALLYGLGFKQAFPIDVWMKRAMSLLFSDGLPSKFSECAGIVQQYIFFYARDNKIGTK